MEKRGLGKGLGALIPGAGGFAPTNAPVAAPGASPHENRSPNEISIETITFNPYQPRKSIDDEKFQELVRSVRLHGIIQPIVVRASGEGAFELVAGERRLRAATAAGLSRVPAVIKDFTNEQSLEVALIENLQREDIGPIEAAIAYKRLADEFSLTQDEIAFRLGKSRSGIANTLRLLNLPEEIQQSVFEKKLTEGHARALLSISDTEKQRELWQRAIELQLSVRELERLCREAAAETSSNVSRETFLTTKNTQPSLPKDPNLVHVEDELRQLFGTKVAINIGKDRGRIEIEFYTDDDLNRILGLLGGAI